MTTAVELLIDVGRALHGDHWQRAMARDLGTNNKTIWRWMQRQSQISPEVIERLIDLINVRQVALGQEHKTLHTLLLRIGDYLRHEDQSASVHTFPARKS